jgi:hypothetical protein
VAEPIDGIGTTFCNGAIDAWGVDALEQAGFQGLKDRLFSRISQLTNVGFMASAAIGARRGSGRPLAPERFIRRFFRDG